MDQYAIMERFRARARKQNSKSYALSSCNRTSSTIPTSLTIPTRWSSSERPLTTWQLVKQQVLWSLTHLSMFTLTELNSRQEGCKQSNVRVPYSEKIIDLPGGQINDPWLVKWFSVSFLPATPSSPSRTLEGLFELTRRPSRALDSPCALLLKLKRYRDMVRCAALDTEVPGHHQEQLTQILHFVQNPLSYTDPWLRKLNRI